MRVLLLAVIMASAFVVGTSAKRFKKCELASVLERKHGLPRSEIKNWVCIAEFESSFNTQATNRNRDGSTDFGIFQVNNRYWCDDSYGKNECRIPCSALLKDDLSDAVACVRKIKRDTDRFRGNGYKAWVAYVRHCQYRNLDDYMSECW